MAIKVEGDVVTMSLEDYNEFLRNELWIAALENNGVDNWDWYDEARDSYREYLKESGLDDD